MLYMVIERFKEAAAPAIYERLHQQGRMTPPGLHYVSSWVDHSFTRCFQVMETDSPSLLDEWTRAWSDLVDFEIVAVHSASDAASLMEPERRRSNQSAGDGG